MGKRRDKKRNATATKPEPEPPATITDWANATPVPVTGLDLAFPAKVVGRLLPPWDVIPEEFRRGRDPWCDVAQHWFFKGLPEPPTAKPGVDRNAALRHLQCVLGSFEPQHEHKIAGAGWLLSQWFEPIQQAAPATK